MTDVKDQTTPAPESELAAKKTAAADLELKNGKPEDVDPTANGDKPPTANGDAKPADVVEKAAEDAAEAPEAADAKANGKDAPTEEGQGEKAAPTVAAEDDASNDATAEVIEPELEKKSRKRDSDGNENDEKVAETAAEDVPASKKLRTEDEVAAPEAEAQ
ncbi:hypothetical protein M3Y99_00451200 [Aphelenchoides fujianensis]|nr:hypothetical protein M3Y99_00451200 [Aphelenchoides fujianensis]